MTVIHKNHKALRIVGGGAAPEPPSFEATFLEQMAIKRFLDFALADIKFQFEQMNRTPGMARDEMQGAQDTAVMLSNYVKGLRGGIEAMTLKPEPA